MVGRPPMVFLGYYHNASRKTFTEWGKKIGKEEFVAYGGIGDGLSIPRTARHSTDTQARPNLWVVALATYEHYKIGGSISAKIPWALILSSRLSVTPLVTNAERRRGRSVAAPWLVDPSLCTTKCVCSPLTLKRCTLCAVVFLLRPNTLCVT